MDKWIQPENNHIEQLSQMSLIPAGEFYMGTDELIGFAEDGEGPTRLETVHAFYMDRYAVTNREFAQFVKETGYVTEAEEYGWSYVFYALLPEDILKTHWEHHRDVPWWAIIEKACWFRPEGPGSSVEGRFDHPVVHVSWNDAQAYCLWADKRLPTEKEWEYAARGGLHQKLYPWGDELTPNGKHQCNIWQGKFPRENTAADGYVGTAPVHAYQPNNYGLYNMVGNVWEWCNDSFAIHGELVIDHDSKVIKGGSYLCHDSYCNRYRVAARSSNTRNSTTGNTGFRCVKDVN